MLTVLKTTISIPALLLTALFSQPVMSLTFVLDFNDPLQANTQTTIFSASQNLDSEVSTFDVAAFGNFGSSNDFDLVTQRVLQEVENDYLGIATGGVSPIPLGQELDIDFLIGDIGVAPINGDGDYYYIQIGVEAGSGGPLGFACGGCVRTSTGLQLVPSHSVVGSIFSDNIQLIGGVGNALSSGDIDSTAYALAGTISHEIGHTLSLGHVFAAGSTTPNGLDPLMGTGAVDLPNAARIIDREFSLQATADGGGTVTNIAQLVGAIGLRNTVGTVASPSTLPLLLFAVLFMLRRKK